MAAWMNLEEIAKLSGVSRSTVSRVINDDPNVRETTRLRVKEVVRQLNYQPNAVARSLAGGRTRILGLVIPEGVTRLFSDPYFPILIQGVSMACNALDYSVMLWLAESEYDRRSITRIVHNKLTDGIIVASMLTGDPLVEALLHENLPFILVGRNPGFDQISYVDVDNLNGAGMAVTHLLRLGHRRIATITGPQNMIAGQERLEGYKLVLRQRNLPFENELVAESDFSEEGGHAAMLRLLQGQGEARGVIHPPEAVFVASDSMAIGAMRALREQGLRVPQDVAIVGFDDIPLASRTEPPLTTVRQPIMKTGLIAAETLIDMIENDINPSRRIIMETELVIRDSCGASEKNGHPARY